LSKVKKCVQITGHFNTTPDFKDQALVLNEASQILVDDFGEAGKHTRDAFGAASLPLNSPVEIQAIFEVW
jgi:NAD(P)H dehydrogenase (quinone)